MSEPSGCELQAAENHLQQAEADVRHALHELERAEADLEHAKGRHEVQVKVDGEIKFVRASTYPVLRFKELVGVAPDRELDILKECAFEPLNDASTITPEPCDVFVSHCRTGGSS